MKLPQLFVLGILAAAGAALAFAQNLSPTVPLASREHQPRAPLQPQGFSWMFNLKGKQYQARITRDQIASGPEWSPDAPLPFSYSKAIEIARVELGKLIGDDSGWEPTELTLRRLADDDAPRWFLLVRLSPKNQPSNVISDGFWFPVALSGQLGTISSR